MKIFSTLCAVALSSTMALTAFVPAQAQQMSRPAVATPTAEQPIQVQSSIERQIRREVRREIRRDIRRDNRRGDYYRDVRRRDNWRSHDRFVYNGHRGYRDYRPGYRRHNGAWFPAAAFVTGAIIGGAIAAQPAPVVRRSVGGSHVNWCYDRYRSYRASDNTFQPYNGPRRQCYSPYS